jgi:hypothetical protein
MIRPILILTMLFVATIASAQEICNNGIDDDFDGFIDCYDGSCASSPDCDGIFLGNDAACQAIPPAFPQFTMSLDFSSPDETTNHLSRMAIGDLDRDGTPEIVTMNRYTNRVFILNGANGSIKTQAAVNFEPYWEIAIGNIDDDNCGEIFFIGYQDPPGSNNSGIYIFAYDCQLNFLWRTAQRLRDDPINFGLADFDGDGKVELYAKDEIYDAHTGVRIVQSTAGTYTRTNGGPVAVDITGDSRLELVLGLAIYQVNLGTRTAGSGSLTLLQSRPEYFVRHEYNATSVADYNQDGFLDVVASGSTIANSQNTTIFFWDVQNNTINTYRDNTGDYAPNGWGGGTGRVNIADLDGDGNLNMSYVSGKYLYALDHNMQLLWRVVINEETSGYTGCTLFDFNGDGKSEIVYRDERYLYIIDGTDGSIFNQQNCISRTNREYPIVADVDADGSTELCVTCGFNDANASANFNTLSYSRYSHVRVFKSAAEPWVPARRVWNQHGYFVVNVNDDLSIPRNLQKHHLVFSNGNCTQGPNRPLNKFLNQAPFLNSEGCPTYAAPNLAFVNTPSVVPPQCPAVDFTVSFQFTNLGDVALNGAVPVSFYSSDPRRAGATKLNTLTFNVNLNPNDVFNVVNANVTGIGSDSLYIVLNDAGTSIPTPISLPNTNFIECDYDNVIGVKINPLPVALTALEVNPNELCLGSSNGSARAFVMLGGVENTTDFNFYWSDGPTAKPIASADFLGAIYSGIPDDTYTVYARHKTVSCGSDTVQVVVTSTNNTSIIDLSVALISDQTQCDPPNGSLEAIVAGGNAGYSFTWEDTGGPIGINSAVLAGRAAGTYTVTVTSPGGCTKIEDGTVGDLVNEPDAVLSSTHITSCANPNSGTISATVMDGGVAQPAGDYVFDWYFYDNASSTRGSQLPALHGAAGTPNRTGLPAGFYEVVITNNTTGCESIPPLVVEVQSQTVTPTVQFTQLAAQTSCDPANPNGSLRADALLGGVAQPAADFTFEWFEGQNTLVANQLPASQLSVPNQEIANELRAGGQSYTVRITSKTTGCFATDFTTITEDLNVPIVTLTTTDNAICNPALASSAFTGSVTASVTFDGVAVTDFTNYSFTWYDGSVVTPTPRAETTSSITQLNTGFYTLVVENTLLGCESTPETEEVGNTTTLPTIAVDADSSTNCLPLAPGVTPNGSATVTSVNGGAPNPALFTFQWHTGNNTAAPIGGETTGTLDDLQGGPGNFFTVLVTNRANGCQNTSTVEIPDGSEKPLITLSASDNSICDPAIAGTSRNGSVTVTSITYKGAAFGGAVSYQWFNGVGTGTPNGSSTTATLNNLAAGNYSATVTLTTLGCVADFATEEVEDDVVLPTIITTPTPSTNCVGGTDNGSIAAQVNVSGVPTTAGFAFQWYQGASIASPVVPTAPNNGNTHTAIQLAGAATYTVEATNLSSGCKNTSTLVLQDDSEIPVITPLTFNPNENCTAPFNGSAAVNTTTPFTYRGTTITNPYTGFNLVWSGGTVNAAGDGISGLAAGVYTLQVTAGASNTVTNNNDNCISLPVQVTILDDLTYPVISVATQNQTSCDPALPNGILTATVGGATTGYTFHWFQGTGIVAPAVDITDPGTPNVIDDLISASYTAQVMDNATRCESTTTVFLPNQIVNPVLSFTSVTDVTSCVPPNGSATPILTNITAMPNTDFTVFYVRTFSDPVNPVSAPSDPAVIKASPDNYSSTSAVVNGTNPPVLTGLRPGFVTGIVVDNFTHCESSPVTIPIIDATVANQINVDAVVAAGFCGGNGGQINITAAGGAGGYTYEWYQGTPSNNNINFFNNPPDMTAATFITNDEDLGVTTPVGGAGSGTYTLVVRDAVGCGAYLVDNVPFAGAPVITITPTDPTRCVAPFDGEIEVDVAGAFGPYSITFYDGNSATDPAIMGEICDDGLDNDGDGLTDAADPDCGNPATLTAINLSSGQYLVRVIDYTAANRPCPLDQTVVLQQRGFAPLVQVNAINGNTACDDLGNADGSVQITVSTNPLDARNPAATPIAFHVTGVAPAPLSAPAFPHVLSSGVATTTNTLNYDFGPTTYLLTITEASSGCVTNQSVTIPDQPVVPVLGQTDIDITNDSFCAPLSNGSAEVSSIVPTAITDYQFSWYSDAGLTTLLYQDNGGGGNGELFNATKPGYALGAAGQGIGTQTYYVQGERLPGTGDGVGCPTPVVQVVIQDAHVTPVVTLTSSPDTSCDPAIGEGSISVATTTTSPNAAVQNALYTYVLSPDPNAVGTLTNRPGALSTPYTQLTDNGGAPFNVVATNEISGCVADADVTILPGQFIITVSDTTVSDKLMCLLDGDITATQITIDRSLTSLANQVFNTPLNANFEFRWFKNAPGTFTTGSPLTDNTPAVLTAESLVVGTGAGLYSDPAPTLGAGTYYVVARQLTGAGRFGANCESVPLRVEIRDESENPAATLTPTTDTSCNGPFEGNINVVVTDASPMAGPFNYNYTWNALTLGRTPPVVANPYNGNNNLFTQVQDGVYELTVLNNVTGCTSVAAQTTVTKTLVPIIVASADPNDQTICAPPDGSIAVIDITVGGVVDPNHANFNFTWYAGDPNGVPFVNAVNNADAVNGIAAGTYYVKASRVLGLPFGSGCESAPLRVDIQDISVDPDLALTAIAPNSSCDITRPNGSVQAVAAERDGTTDNYTFAWTLNAGALHAATIQTDATPQSTLTAAPEGSYEVTTTNTLSGCTFTSSITLNLNQALSVPSVVSVLPVNPVDCFPTGSASVVQITIGGTTVLNAPPDDIDTDFDYLWYREEAIPANQIAGVTNSMLPNQLPGTYFVSVQDLRTNCISSFIEFVIDSADIIYPDVVVRQTSPQVICDVVNLGGSGSLVATVDLTKPVNSRNNLANYDLFWYANLDTLGAAINAVSDSVVTNLLAGDYSLKVFDRTTNCRAKAIFILPNDSTEFKPELSLSNDPRTMCNIVDGMISAQSLHFTNDANTLPSEIYPFPYNYVADMYNGATPNLNNPPDFVMTYTGATLAGENFEQQNLDIGVYTVRITDSNTGCVTIGTAEVLDGRVFPAPVVTTLAAVTNCDPTRPNGAASVSNTGNLMDFQFDWYEGNVVAGVPVFTGIQYTELKPDPTGYIIRATNLQSGCTGDVPFTIPNSPVPIPAPQIDILSHVTSCIFGNGALSASVNGNTKDYIFHWYDGTTETPPADFVGEIYDSLVVGPYSVTATSRITGCKSPLVTEDIESQPEFPELRFVADPATCGLSNGFASIIIRTDVPIEDVEWRDANGTLVDVGPNLTDVLPGVYTVTVVTQLGCESSLDVEIDSEIRPFNGISRNNDGRNEIFYIDCIQEFPGNIVRIYNRAGTLVYEGHNYDNIDIYFDGKSNKGVSPMGNNLPDGTYFYIIDKRDGSKPLAGYLEIVN